jgi:hypothetical protein
MSHVLAMASHWYFFIAECESGHYWTGYNCLPKQYAINTATCPLDAAFPPASGMVSCQDGGQNFWYIHVGGEHIHWDRGTDAECLSTSSRQGSSIFIAHNTILVTI